MANEYLNNKRFEKIICEFQELKRQKNRYELMISDIVETEARTLTRKKFVKPEAWIAIQSSFATIKKDYDLAQKELTTAFYTLSENIVRYAKFNLIDPEDAIQEGVIVCFEKIDRFDPSRGKAFNYWTTIILNAFRQLYRSSRNYNELKNKYRDSLEMQVERSLINFRKSKNFYRIVP